MGASQSSAIIVHWLRGIGLDGWDQNCWPGVDEKMERKAELRTELREMADPARVTVATAGATTPLLLMSSHYLVTTISNPANDVDADIRIISTANFGFAMSPTFQRSIRRSVKFDSSIPVSFSPMQYIQ
jgi:hypothetical protein